MRIGIDAHFVGVRHGGNEYLFENLLRSLARMEPNGDSYYAFSLDLKAAKLLERERLELVELKKPSVYLQRALEIPAHAKRLKLDLLHVPFNFLPVGKYKKVITVHDLAFLHLKDAFTFTERMRMSLMTSFCAKRADHIFTDSEYSKADIVKNYGITESKISVALLAVDQATFSPWKEPDKEAFRKARGLDYPYILHVGTLQPRKNVITLLKAFKSMAHTDEEVHLALVGRKGWIYEELFTYIRENGLEQRVHHFEGVGTRDLAGFYNCATALAFPSVFEGFGVPILEAMACGCPVVSANVTSMPEVYGDAALPFSPHDEGALAECLRQVLRNPSLQRALINKGFENGKRFSWDKTATQIHKVYHSL